MQAALEQWLSVVKRRGEDIRISDVVVWHIISGLRYFALHSGTDFVTEDGRSRSSNFVPSLPTVRLSLIRTALLLQPPSNYLIEGIEKIELRCSERLNVVRQREGKGRI